MSNRVYEAGFAFHEAGLKLDVTRWGSRFLHLRDKVEKLKS